MLYRAVAILTWGLALAGPMLWWPLFPKPVAASQAPLGHGASAPAVDLATLQHILGAHAADHLPPSAEPDTQLQLTGVIAAPHNQQAGAALISIDGKPSQPFQVGTSVKDRWVLLSVQTRSAQIRAQDGSKSMTLELPSHVTPLPAGPGGNGGNGGPSAGPAGGPMSGPTNGPIGGPGGPEGFGARTRPER